MSDKNKIYNISAPFAKIYYCTPCLLCGKGVRVNFPNSAPMVCEDCKTLWKKIKEKENEERAD